MITRWVEPPRPPLHEHVVLVTGGNRGLGLAIASGVARAGADVIIWGRDANANQSAQRSIEALGVRCLASECDVTDEAAVSSRFAEAVDRFGRLDAVFANAGAAPRPTPFTELDLAEWRAAVGANLDGTFLCLRQAARHLVAQGAGGALVATSSLAASHGTPCMQGYAAGKAAVEAMVRGLALELARDKIRANVLVPGWFDTALTAAAKNSPAYYERTLGRIPQRRWGDPNELERIAVFLADKSITLHTGATVVVDGGYGIA